MTIFFALILAFISAVPGSLIANPTGWHNPIKIADNTNYYSVFKNENLENIYAVTEHLKGKFNEKNPSSLEIKLHLYNGQNKVFSEIIQTIKLEAAPVLFPLYPAIAASKNGILVAWQETNYKIGGTVIKYIFKPAGASKFNSPTIIKSKNGNTAILPYLLIDDKERFHLFYQQELEATHFTLMHAVSSDANFSEGIPIVSDVNYIGRGIFFPSVAIENEDFYLFYQNRLQKSVKDDIFLIFSSDYAESFDEPEKLTDNNYNDFSPSALLIDDKLEWVWQANPEKSWSIFYGQKEGGKKKISNTNANCYLPQIAYLNEAGRVIVWHDFRESPAQIYGIFINKKDNEAIGNEHKITLEKSGASEPRLHQWQHSIYLFYLSDNALFSKKADTKAHLLSVSSSTHPTDTPVNNTKALFNWNVLDEPSGVDRYAYILDKTPDTVPVIYNLESQNNRLTLDKLTGGRHYLHIKYRDNAGNESKTAHYPIIIDLTPPSAPVIESPSHPENTGSDKTGVLLKFESQDDDRIKRYRYAFSKNRAAKPKKTTLKNEIIIDNVKPDNYFFVVQAEDFSGNFSEISAYEVIVTSASQKDYFLINNISSGQLTGNNLKITVIPRKKKLPQIAYLSIDSKSKDPYQTGEKLEFQKSNEGYSFSYDISKFKEGLFVASLGIEFSDSTQSETHEFFFERIKDIKKPKKMLVIKDGKRYAAKPSPKKRGSFVPEIEIEKMGNLIEINFLIGDYYKDILNGYIWHLTKKPEIPSGEINSAGGPEYIYNLEPGTYYLAVKPVFSKNLQKEDIYAYTAIIIEPFLSRKTVIILAPIALFLFILGLISYLKKDLMRFLISRFTKKYISY
ncbi:MAG: hypothetical protein OEZ13_10480 [Spirochaetia bacterium]|nr:hypothetical protein [Spirochaetia bacterium]